MWFFDSETHVSMFGTIRKQFYCALFANALDFWEKHLLAKCDIFKVFFYIKFSCNNISNFLHFSIRSQCYNEFIRSRVVIHMILLDCFKLLLLFLLWTMYFGFERFQLWLEILFYHRYYLHEFWPLTLIKNIDYFSQNCWYHAWTIVQRWIIVLSTWQKRGNICMPCVILRLSQKKVWSCNCIIWVQNGSKTVCKVLLTAHYSNWETKFFA